MTDQHGENPTEPVGEGSSQPESSATPPSAPPPAAPAPPAAGATSYDTNAAKASLQGAHKLDLGIVAAGVIAWLAGFMPFYTASVSAGVISASTSGSAYHGFFGWFAVWVALAGALVVAAGLFGVSLPLAVHQVAAVLFGVALVCLILALFIFPGGDCGDAAGLGGISCDTGRGFGYWLALLAVLAGGALSVMRMRESTAADSTTA
jgi:hypothetical protein